MSIMDVHFVFYADFYLNSRDPVPWATAASWIKDLQRNLWVLWLRHYYSGEFDLKWPTHSLLDLTAHSTHNIDMNITLNKKT